MIRSLLAAALLLLGACSAAAPAQERSWSPGAIDELLSVAADAPREGLPAPSAQIEALLAARTAPDGDVDTPANALFLRLAQDFAMGRTAPARAEPSWKLVREAPDLTALRASALRTGRISTTLRALLPANTEYIALRDALAAARADGGDNARIPALRANLERWRWAPRDWPTTRVEIRVPFYMLLRYEAGAVGAEHRVIVGALDTPTPSFAAAIEAVTINPYWTPPASILVHELLPSFRRDPERVTRQDYEVLDKNGAALDPLTVDWSARPFPHRVRQKPGAQNALGRLKFEMPNPYAIYLHDTPSRGLFERETRAFSHGCMRVQNPLNLAAALGAGGAADIGALIAAAELQRIDLSAPIPVFVLYFTAMQDGQGAVRYAPDIYKRDARLVQALDADDQALTALPLEAVVANSRCAAR